jgi:mRNA-degrading endonuclease toxin of MazEF toxin-antitoxin module
MAPRIILLKKPYSIWWAKYPNDDNSEGKVRPVLVIDPRTGKCLCLKMTGTAPQTAYDFSISHWREAGLHKATTIKTNKSRIFLDSDLTMQIGDLHPDDIVILQYKHLTFK